MSKINVFSYPYLDQRIIVESIITQKPSDILFPFYSACWLVPKSKAATMLNGAFETNKFYKIKQSEYATKCTGELLKGATTFYSQPRSASEMGVIVFEDQYKITPDNPDQVTNYEDAPEANRLATMTEVIGSIGRNAIYIGVAETNFKRYSMMIDDFRQADTSMKYIKAKVRNTLTSTEQELKAFKDDFEKFGATLMYINQNAASKDGDNMEFDDRLDFVGAGVWLNPYKPNDVTYAVGVTLDGLIPFVKNANVVYNKEKAMLDEITKNYFTYVQVRGDDPDEYILGGGGVFYQGKAIPANLFMFAKYAEYVLKEQLFLTLESNKFGVANASVYNRAVSQTATILEKYVGAILNSLITTIYTQQQINESVVDKVAQLDNCIVVETMPTFLFTKASLSIGIN